MTNTIIQVFFSLLTTISGIRLSMSTSWYGFEEERDTMSTAARPVSAVSAASTPNFFNSIFIIFRIEAESN